jgi:hypothetical protein
MNGMAVISRGLAGKIGEGKPYPVEQIGINIAVESEAAVAVAAEGEINVAVEVD